MNENKTVLLPSSVAQESLTGFNTNAVEPMHMKKQPLKYLFQENENNIFRSSNPYITLSKPLFRHISQLLNTYEVNNIKDVHAVLRNEIDLFTQNAAQYHLESSQVLVVRYLLCTFLDELICTTFWGKNYDWAHESLLSHYYKETYGGEKFFQLLNTMLASPANYIYQLEFMYVCIALGFEGKYRIQTRGKMELDTIKENLYKQIKLLHGKEKSPFYPEPKISKKQHLFFYKVPYLKLIAVASVLILTVYIVLSIMLSNQENDLIPIVNNEIIKQNNAYSNKSDSTLKKEMNVEN